MIGLLLALVGAWSVFASPAAAQMSPVSLSVDAADVGVMGRVMPGQWTGMRLTVEHRGGEARQVVCRWLVTDRDGDRVAARREVTLSPNRTQQVWLYAPLPGQLGRQAGWTVQVLGADGEQLLASTRVGPRGRLDPRKQTLAVMATAGLGLEPYTDRSTRHEAIELVRGLSMADLPDRWYGLSALDAMVWTQQGGGPGDIPDADVNQALTDWVRRGGHLILSLPAFNRGWGDSNLDHLLPVDPQVMRRRTGVEPPSVLGPVTSAETAALDLTVFDLSQDSHAAVLARDEQNNPLIVAGRVGLGRVTLIGVDLTDSPVVRMGLPFGKYRIWNRIFRWQAPVLSESTIEAQIENQQMSRVGQRQGVTLDKFIPPMIAMRGTAAPMLLGAIVVFGVYWVLAGPVAYFALKQRGLVHYSWLGFLLVVVVFLGISWGGALTVQTGQNRVSHFTVLTGRADSNAVQARSWLSLLVPEFGRTTVALGASEDQETGGPAPPSAPTAGPNTLAAPGFATAQQGAGFTDQRLYQLDAASPNRAAIPFRATAKQLQLNYQGPLNKSQAGVGVAWAMPRGDLRLQNHWPVGELGHGLPGTLHDVLMVYCPGDGAMPWVWRHGDWRANTLLDVAASRQQHSLSRLVKSPGQFAEQRNWAAEGFLGQLIDAKAARQFVDMDAMRLTAADSELIKASELLTFYQALPPPNFRKVSLGDPAITYQRAAGDALDLTHLTDGRRLILIGYLKNAPLPAPLTVEGETVASDGWTVVRWIHDFEGPS